jgi:asparagine synthase (glutamine-hydrolysing)
MDNRIKRGGRLFNYPSASRLHSHIFSQEQYFFSEQELDRMLIRQAFDFTDLNDLHVDKTLGTPAERQALWDIQHYLKDDLLVKVDRASMRYSLETRVPLLDTRLIELGMNIDYSLKVRGQYGSKYLMKKVLYEMVPREIFERPKRGFAIPLKEWLYGPLKHLTQDYLNEDIVRTYGIVDAGLVKELLRKFYAGEDYLYNRIWLLIVLHWWLKDNDATLNKSALVA